VENILEHLDKNDTSIGIYFGLKKLLILLIIIYFCTTCISMVSEELCMNGLKFYLQNRQQCTIVQHCVSSNATVTFGALKGSVLGPLLFLICINDIGKAIPNEKKIKLFADDTNLFILDADSNGLCLNATDYLDKLNLWFLSNTTVEIVWTGRCRVELGVGTGVEMFSTGCSGGNNWCGTSVEFLP